MSAEASQPPAPAPPPAEAVDAEALVDAKLVRVWNRERALAHLRGAAWTLCVLLPVLLLHVVLDWLLDLPWLARLVQLALLLSAAGLVAYGLWWRRLRPFSHVRAALQVERCHPELRSLLISYVQFGADWALPSSVSPQLVRAVRDEAVTASVALDFDAVVRFGVLKRLALAAGLVVLAFAFAGAACPAYLRQALVRLILPSADYPRRTQIQVLSGDLAVPEGAPVEIRFKGGGLVPTEGTLRIRFEGDEKRDEVSLLRQEGDLFAYRIDSARKSFTYFFTLGDARAPRHAVRVARAPRLKQFTVTAWPPPYTHLPADVQDKTLNLRVLEGTQVQWHVAFDQPLSGLKVLLDRKDSGFKTEVLGETATFQWTADRTAAYRLVPVAQESGFTFVDEVEYAVDVKPDEPPQVEILKPRREEKSTAQWQVPIEARASDDYGLAEARLVSWMEGGQEKTTALGKVQGNPSDLKVAWKLKDAWPNLQPGDTVNYALEVSDNYGAGKGPHWSRSNVQSITILSPDEYQEWIQSQRNQLNSELESLLKVEESDSEGVRRLKELLRQQVKPAP